VRRRDNVTYPAAAGLIPDANGFAFYVLTDTDTAIPGEFVLEIQAIQGDKIVKSNIIESWIEDSLSADTDTPPPSEPSWVQDILKAVDAAISAGQAASEAADQVTEAMEGLQDILQAIEDGMPVGPPGPQGVPGQDGQTGPQGLPGQGVPSGGAVGAVLRKTGTEDYAAEWEKLAANDVGAVPVTRTVNEKELSADITLGASDVNAVPSRITGTTGAISQIKIPEILAGLPLSVTAKLVATQTGTGDPSPENIRPIVGHDTVNIWRTGKNLYDVSNVQSSSSSSVKNADGSVTATLNNASGASTVYSNWFTGPNKALVVGKQYALIIEILNVAVTGTVALFLSSGSATESQVNDAGSIQISSVGVYKKIITPTKAWNETGVLRSLRTYVAAYAGSSVTITYRLSIVEDETTSTTGFVYEPFINETFSVTLPEVLYGLPGAEDKVDFLTGVVTRRTRFTILDSGTVFSSEVSGDYARFTWTAFQNIGLPKTTIYCSHLPSRPGSTGFYQGFGIYNTTAAESVRCFIAFPLSFFGLSAGATTAQALNAFKIWLDAQKTAGTPVTVFYKLATPTVENINPVFIPTISGTNIVYADIGDVATEFTMSSLGTSGIPSGGVAGDVLLNAGTGNPIWGRITASDVDAIPSHITGTAGAVSQIKIPEVFSGLPLSATTKLVAAQAGTGDPSPDNNRPIVGHGAMNIWRGGSNLINPAKINVYKSAATLSLLPNGLRATVTNTSGTPFSYIDIGPLSIFAGKTMTLYFQRIASNGNSNFRISTYTSNDSYGNRTQFGSAITTPGKETFVVSTSYPEENTRLLLSVYPYYGSGNYVTGDYADFLDIQLELGPDATPYEIYNGQTFPVTLSEGLYGMPDAEDEWHSGGIAIRRTMLAVLNGTEDWKSSSAANQVDVIGFYYAVPDLEASNAVIMSNTFNFETSGAQNKELIYRTSSPNGIGIRVNRSRLATQGIAGFKAWLAALYAAGTPVMALYKLAAPITESISPVSIPSLFGMNTVYTDSGGEVATRISLFQKILDSLSNIFQRLSNLESTIAGM